MKSNIGMTFGNLLLISEEQKVYSDGNRMAYKCKCSCGNTKVILAKSITSGKSKSCGCGHAGVNKSHGESKSKEYKAWRSMKDRCTTNEKYKYYDRYFGRGIRICERWINSFENFLLDMGLIPVGGYTLDRIENDGNYEPGNCKWSTITEQQSNRSDNHFITLNKEKVTVTELSRRLNVRHQSLIYQLKKHPIDFIIKNKLHSMKKLTVMILAMMLGSCATYQKKLEKFQNFALNNPVELSKLCADKFPVKEVVKPGRVDTVPGKTVFVTGKTIYVKGETIKCPDDSVQCPPSTKAQPDTVYREDTAKLFVALDKYDKARDTVSQQKGTIKELKGQLKKSDIANTQKTWTIVALIAIIGAGVLLKIKGIL